MPTARHPHVTAALRYARGVVGGRIPAGQWVRAACQRQLDDLAREKSAGWPFRFDRVQAERICRFLELLPHVKGEWAGQPLALQPHQQFKFTTIFGWVRKSDSLRRFRKVYVREPRKNAKSTESARVGIYMLAADNEPGAEVYSGATTEKQAMEVFRPAWQMVNRTPALRARFGLELSGNEKNPGAIYCPRTGSRFEPVIGKPGDGPSPHCAIVDEYHEHDSSEQLDAMDTGMGARRQPLLWVITTAGANLESPCYKMDQQAQKVLGHVIDDETLFAIMYGIDPQDDWTDFENWIKANPNYGISVKEDYLRAQWKECLQNASRQNILKTKHLDEWCNARTAWMNMHEWEMCCDPLLTPDDVAEHPLYLGLDLATKTDLAARVSVFTALIKDGTASAEPEFEEEANSNTSPRGYRRHYWAFCKTYAPEFQAHDPKNTTYAGWEHEEYLTVTPGNEIDLNRIEDDIRADVMGQFDLRELAFDPWRATQLVQTLAAEGVTTVEVRPLVQNFSPVMKEITAAVRAGRFHHDGNPILTWFVSNVVSREDNKGEVYPTKESKDSPLKIDGAVAMFMGVSRAMVGVNQGEVYDGHLHMAGA